LLGRVSFSGSADFNGLALSARGIAADYPAGDEFIALGFRDVNLASPGEPRKAPLPVPFHGARVNISIFGPPLLLPVAPARDNEQVFLIRHFCTVTFVSTVRDNLRTAAAVSPENTDTLFRE
jgi:hypothetical protein